MIRACLLLSIWMIACILFCASKAARVCSENKKNNDIPMRQCLASCLGVVESFDVNQQPCYYNAKSGKSKGCGKPSAPNTKKNVLVCDQGIVHDWALIYTKPCDMIYFTVLDLTTKSDVLTVKKDEYAHGLLQHAPKLREMGIKILGQVQTWEAAVNVMRISETNALREKFAASVMDIMEKLQLDGMYFDLCWPGCPWGGLCKSANPHKNYTVNFFAAISKLFKSTGRVLITQIPQSPLVQFQLGADYYSDVMPYVDYFILETGRLVNHGNSKTDFNFNLKLIREWVKVLVNKVKNPLFGRRLLISFNIHIMAYQLKNPNDERINVAHIRGKKYNDFLMQDQWCKLVRPGSGYKVVPSNDSQNYPVKGDHLFTYDDVTSLKEKMDWFMSFGGGAHVWNTWADDVNNECGCGRQPYVRTVADLAKSTDCDPMPCF